MLKLWGVPFFVWSGICLILAIVWVFVWPADRAVTLTGVRLFVLRWFHALTWLLLAIAALAAAFPALAATSIPRMVALAALAVYLTFLAVTVSR